MRINKFFNLFLIVLSTFLITSKFFAPISANAVDFCAGYTVAANASNRYGIVARFRALDFTLSESDAIYNSVVGLAIFGIPYNDKDAVAGLDAIFAATPV